MTRIPRLDRVRRSVILVFAVLFGVVLIRTAWVNDDAYITLRTVDNFVSGRGLTWNPDERVQAYTHPLWMFLLAGPYALTHESYLTTIAVSMLVSLAAYLSFSAGMSSDLWATVIGTTALVLSKSFVDFSTSGMENPVTHLLLVGFVLWYLSGRTASPRRRLLALGLLTSAAVLIRPDLLLIVLPALIHGLVKTDGAWKTRTSLLAGLVPVIAWEGFSLLYYGSLIPNTALAKLNTGVPWKDLLEQGVLYVLNAIDLDPLSMAILAAGLVWAALWGSGAQRRLALGVCLYLGYAVSIGGDFMSGRLFTPAVLVSCALLVKLVAAESQATKLIVLAAVITLGFSSPTPTLLSDSSYTQPVPSRNGIEDERSYYYAESGLLSLLRNVARPSHPWAEQGRVLAREGRRVIAQDAVGYIGYFAGPEIHIVDELGLADAFLSRLPTSDLYEWRIGHFRRDIPDGYMDSIRTGENHIVDPDLAPFYEKIRLITTGELFDPERLRAIWELNTGQYSHWLDGYLARTAEDSPAAPRTASWAGASACPGGQPRATRGRLSPGFTRRGFRPRGP